MRARVRDWRGNISLKVGMGRIVEWKYQCDGFRKFKLSRSVICVALLSLELKTVCVRSF